MAGNLMALQCPSCGGLLRSLDARAWRCAYCQSQYMLLGEEHPIPGLMRIFNDSDKEKFVGLYLWEPEHVRWDSPRDVKERARAMGLAWQEGRSELQIAKLKARAASCDFTLGVGKPRPQPEAQPMQIIGGR